MNEPLSETEKALRDTLLNLCDDESFDTICQVYGWPRPEWIPRENWRRAIRVATYGPKGTFNTLRAFCQAAFAFLQIRIPYERFVVDKTGTADADSAMPTTLLAQKESMVYNISNTFRRPWTVPNVPPPPGHQVNYDENQIVELGLHIEGNAGNHIRFQPFNLEPHIKEAFDKYPTNIHRDVLVRGNDGNHRMHRIIYEHADNKFKWKWYLSRVSSGYWRGFPRHTWWPYKNHKPFEKTGNEQTTPTPYSDGNADVDLPTERIEGEACYLMPFTFTEPSVGVYKGWNENWPEYQDQKSNGKKITYPTPARVQSNFIDQVCTVKLHTFFDIPNTGTGVPPSYVVGANVESSSEGLGVTTYKRDYYAKVIIALPQMWDHPVNPVQSPENPLFYTDENGVLLPEHYPGGWDARRILAPHNNIPSHYWYYKPMAPRVDPAAPWAGPVYKGDAVEPGGARKAQVWDYEEASSPGQEFGAQLLDSDLDKGRPFNEDGEVGRSGQLPDKLEGPHPPYLKGGESVEAVSELLTAFAKLLPVGVTLEIVQEYGPLYSRYYDWDTDNFMIWGKDIDPEIQTGKTNTWVPVWNNPDVAWDNTFSQPLPSEIPDDD